MFEIELFICIKIDLALNNLQWLIFHKTKLRQVDILPDQSIIAWEYCRVFSVCFDKFDYICHIFIQLCLNVFLILLYDATRQEIYWIHVYIWLTQHWFSPYFDSLSNILIPQPHIFFIFFPLPTHTILLLPLKLL